MANVAEELMSDFEPHERPAVGEEGDGGRRGATAVLDCVLATSRVLSDALSCIGGGGGSSRGDEVVISAGGAERGGLRFTAEDRGCVQASVLLDVECFAEFCCRDDDLNVRVRLTELNNCLALFGGAVSGGAAGRTAADKPTGAAASAVAAAAAGRRSSYALKIEYAGFGQPLQLSTKQRDVCMQCTMRTIVGGQLTDFRFLGAEIFSTLILSSDALRDALQELDYGGAKHIELRLAPNEPKVQFESRSNSGAHCTVRFPDPDAPNEVFTVFRSKCPQTSIYRLSLLKGCIKAVSMSDTSRLRMNADGMLSVSVKLRPPGHFVPGNCYIEFLVVAEEIDELQTAESNSPVDNE